MTTTARARPLAPDERRASIIEAVIPLLLEHGQTVTSKQIADAAGVAEGTVFRAFGDKESLIEAAVETFFSEPRAEDGVLPDPALPLEVKLEGFVAAARTRVRDVMRMSMLMRRPPTMPRDGEALYRWRVSEIFGPHADELSVTLDELGSYLRALAIGTSVPGAEVDDALIARIALGGLRCRPASTTDSPQKA